MRTQCATVTLNKKIMNHCLPHAKQKNKDTLCE